MKKKILTTWIASLFLLSGLVGCGEDFEPFTEVTDLRVLAIQVEPAELSPGETGRIRGLVVGPNESEISYQWSWCPVVTSSLTGHECPIDEAMLLEIVEQNSPLPVAIPPGVSLFDLGNEQEAVFPFILDEAVLSAACQQITQQLGDELSFAPDCEGSLSTSVKLVVSDGEKSITAVKELNLLLNDELIPNENPSLTGVSVEEEGMKTTLGEANETLLQASSEYQVTVEVPLNASESFDSVELETGDPIVEYESLFMTWFITGGATEFGRTSFVPGETDFEKIQQNVWTSPSMEELGGRASLYLVLQDERGGVSWLSRDIQLQER